MIQPDFRNKRHVDTAAPQTNAVVSNTSNTEKEDEVFRINVDEPKEFPNLLRGGLITSFELMHSLSELFTPAYKDYAGCHIMPMPGRFDIKLFFKTPIGDNGAATSAFRLYDNRPSNNLLDRVSNLNRRNTKTYEITEHGKQGLSDFFLTPGGSKINWNMVISEDAVAHQLVPGNIAPQVYAVVSNLDINRVISKIYGDTLDGERVQYFVSPIKIIGLGNEIAHSSPNTMQNWLLSVQAISLSELSRAQKTVGVYYENGIPMVGRTGEVRR